MSPYRDPDRPAETYRHGPFMRAKRALQRARRRLLSAKVIRPKCTACGAPAHAVARDEDLFSAWYYCGCVDERCTCNKPRGGRCPVHQCMCNEPVAQRCPVHRLVPS